MPKFYALHYNFVAKRIREVFPDEFVVGPTPGSMPKTLRQHERDMVLSVRTTLTELALNFAKSFAKDNEAFDPIKFLDACSPDPEQWPLSELWDGEEVKRETCDWGK